tara:strand:- start:48 stop:1064 length:1017 start_codon:yes stop_codon:yes gene_type:complete
MIKLKDIIRESKAKGILAEAFRSSILRKMVNNFQGLDRDFFTYGAKLGVQWDKVTDSQIEKNTKPKKKGIEFAVATKKMDLPSKKRYGDYNSIRQVEKGTALIVLRDGKPLWYTKSWRNVDQKRKGATGKGDSMQAGPRSSLYGDDKMSFGIDKFGYQSLAAVQSLPGIVYYQVTLDENMPYMGGKEKRELRQAVGEGSWKWKSDGDFKRGNERKYKNLLAQTYKDKKKVNAKVKAAKDFTNGLIAAAIGGKPSAKFDKLLKQYNSWTTNEEKKVYEYMSRITRSMEDLYADFGRYIEATKYDEQAEKEKGAKLTYYRADDDARRVAAAAGRIMQGKF